MNKLKEFTPKEFKFTSMDSQTTNRLNQSVFSHAKLERGTLWSQYTKLCEVLGLNMYTNDDGKIVVHASIGLPN